MGAVVAVAFLVTCGPIGGSGKGSKDAASASGSDDLVLGVADARAQNGGTSGSACKQWEISWFDYQDPHDTGETLSPGRHVYRVPEGWEPYGDGDDVAVRRCVK